jgi:hypothetical protein
VSAPIFSFHERHTMLQAVKGFAWLATHALSSDQLFIIDNIKAIGRR